MNPPDFPGRPDLVGDFTHKYTVADPITGLPMPVETVRENLKHPTTGENGGSSSAAQAPFDVMGPEPLCGSSHSFRAQARIHLEKCWRRP